MISADLLRAGNNTLQSLLAAHVTSFFGRNDSGSVEELAVILRKTVDRDDLRNYHPISLLRVLYKLFTKIILTRISRTLNEAQLPEQAGFRQGSSCVDHIQRVAMVIEVCREYHLLLVLTFVDYEKAFDSVETNTILSALVDQGVDSSYIRTLADCYHRCSTAVQLFRHSINILIEKGVRQGDTISPKLFTATLQLSWMSLNSLRPLKHLQ